MNQAKLIKYSDLHSNQEFRVKGALICLCLVISFVFQEEDLMKSYCSKSDCRFILRES